jgi:hypothetical protein
MADRHNIGVTWHLCLYCDYRAKQKGHVRKHAKNKHPNAHMPTLEQKAEEFRMGLIGKRQKGK